MLKCIIRYFTCLACLALVMLAARPAEAHRVNIFAWVDGEQIHVDCAFSRGNKVRGGRIEARAAVSGELLASGRTDTDGVFIFPVPEQARAAKLDLRVYVDAGEGHKASWLLKAADFSPAGSLQDEPEQAQGEKQALPAEAFNYPELKRALGETLDAALEVKLAPLRTMLMEHTQSGPELKDIIGGIGWLIGLAGIAAYFRRRA